MIILGRHQRFELGGESVHGRDCNEILSASPGVERTDGLTDGGLCMVLYGRAGPGVGRTHRTRRGLGLLELSCLCVGERVGCVCVCVCEVAP